MTHALRPRVLHIPPIDRRTRLPHAPAPANKHKHRRIARSGQHGAHDKHVPGAQGVLPRRDAVVDGERQRVADQDQRCDQLAAEVAVRGRCVLDRGREAQRRRHGEDGLRRHEREPVQVWRGG